MDQEKTKKAESRKAISRLVPVNSTDLTGSLRNIFWQPDNVIDGDDVVGNEGSKMARLIKERMDLGVVVTLKCTCPYM